MPPKKGGGGGGNKPSKKTVDKAKQKVIEDKTFGLKNKNKSKTVQKYMQSVQAQVKGNASKKAIEAEYKKKKEKEEAEKKKALEKELFKPVVTQTKVPIGVDPKSVVCEFFKLGMCNKGNKCKFSHNLEQERKPDKIDIYTDQREDSMDNWDQEKLEKVVEEKNKKNPQRKTTIVCKYFLEAIEKKKYGWFWECPNGGVNCQYMHSLPRGYVLKSQQKKEEPKEQISIEEQIEEERAKLTTRTPLTLEVFLKWKEEKKKESEQKAKEAKEKKDADIRSGKAMRSGRHLFTFNPDLFVDDEDVMDTSIYEAERTKDEGPVYRLEATGTSITRIEETKQKDDGKQEEEAEEVAVNGVQEDLFNEDEIPDIEEDE